MVRMEGFVTFLLLLIISVVTAFPSENRTKPIQYSRRVHIPILGMGPYCNGCPEHFCDDDPAMIFGFCCGCARFYDNLPIQCSTRIECPLNGYELCQDYEYMMYCCC